MPQALSVTSSITYSKKRVKTRRILKRKEGRCHLPVFFVSFLIILCFFSYLYLNLKMVEINFDLRDKEKELIKLEQDIERLNSQIKEFTSLDKLQEAAKELKLVRANDVRYLKGDYSSSTALGNK
ncbi:hypothetical protein J7J39_03205 [bacterium]|nr:hypothetical protein [bacterium]